MKRGRVKKGKSGRRGSLAASRSDKHTRSGVDSHTNVESDADDTDCMDGSEGSDVDGSDSDGCDADVAGNVGKPWYSTSAILLRLSAMGDLYRHQCEDRDNLAMDYATVSAPKTYVQTLVDAYRLRMSVLKRSTDTDFGTVDFTQNPTSVVRQLMKWFWMSNVKGAASLGKRGLKGLRDRMDVSLCFFLMVRSEVTRHIRLPDLFAHDVEPNRNRSGGDAHCKEDQFVLGVLVMMRQGKTNKDNKIQYTLAVRNKDVEMCPVGALAFFLLQLWSVSRFLDICSRSRYYCSKN